MHDAARMRAIMRWSIGLLLLLAVGACGSTAKPGSDGGGGSNAGGAGGTTGGGGRGGAAAARRDPWADRAAVAAPAAARRIRSGVPAASPAPARATSAAVPASPVLRRTAEPARLDRAARPAAEAPAVVAVRPARAAEVATAAARADAAESGGGTGGTGGAAVCGTRACTGSETLRATELRRNGPALSSCSRWRPVSERIHVSVFLRQHRHAAGPGPGCEPPPCTPPAPFCFTRPASCGATVTCSCLPANVCQGGGGCGLISGGEVLCLSA